MVLDGSQVRRQLRRKALESGPFVLESLLNDVPLSADGDRDDIKINCVEFLDANLYVGTSASEILHFVQIPPDPAEIHRKPQYILASRLPPSGEATNTPDKLGVQQILLLPKVQKACVLCNDTITFYSLPELSPIFESAKVPPCGWVGGLDLNEPEAGVGEVDSNATTTILLSQRKKIRVVKIGHEARGSKLIDFSGSTISVRRDSFACVADSRSYALLDVERQLKIPLFPISSLDESHSSNIGGRAEDISGGQGSGVQRSSSTVQKSNLPSLESRGHNRSTSLGSLISSHTTRQRALSYTSKDGSRSQTPERLTRVASPAPASSPLRHAARETSPSKLGTSPEKEPPIPPSSPSPNATPASVVVSEPIYLRPHIVSPSPQEFLLVTGTGPSDPGVGMFVNLEGDVTRSTLEFERYPEALVSDGRGVGIELTPNNAEEEEEGYVLASMQREVEGDLESGLEIQRWDLDPGEGNSEKFWLPILDNPLADETVHEAPGLRYVADHGDVTFEAVVEKLRLKRFRPKQKPQLAALRIGENSAEEPADENSGEQKSREPDGEPEGQASDGIDEARDEEEALFAQRLGRSKTRLAVWSGNHIWWALRNPLTLRLDATLEHAYTEQEMADNGMALDRQRVVEVINALRGQEAKSEIEFVSLGYIRQRAGLILLENLVSSEIPPLDAEDRIAEEALLHGGLDPRVILALIPLLRQEVFEGKNGIWVHGGVLNSVTKHMIQESESDQGPHEYVLHFYRRFLTAYRTKKGFGSIASEKEVFRSVDACLLVVLLELDKNSSRGPERKGSIRSELGHLVDNGVDCFERAIEILESYHRLYVLSRLYQSRKMAGEVLATWKRIIEGEQDNGGEFRDGEQVLRNYLSKISNQALIQEYGVWLASRNTKLGIQVFADDKSKVKFVPTQVVEILRQGAPAAVKEYLEYLVFGKNHSEYVNELIAYYLDNVIEELEKSDEAKSILAQSYESYRKLQAPKPTYRQFVTDNAIEKEWWHSRLRLLQLLGGSHGSTSEYNVSVIASRIEPFTQYLVPEVIILNGRQSRHQDALRLLTHNLGDFDTAINYCLLGGSSIYHPISGSTSYDLPSRDEQANLFGYLLAEVLQLENISSRVEQTSSLLERFGGWFDVSYVLSVIPDSWSVELVSGFLVSALRRIVRERSETMIVKALSGSENLKTSADLIGKIESVGPQVKIV